MPGQSFLEKTNQSVRFKLTNLWLPWLGLAIVGLGIYYRVDRNLSGALILGGCGVAGAVMFGLC